MKNLSMVGVALLGLLSLSSGASAACNGNTNPQLVRNDSFESGTTVPIPFWNVAFANDAGVFISTVIHKSGAHSLALTTENGENRVSQTLSGTVAGSVYTVCFWLQSYVQGTTGTTSLRAQWNNQDMVVLKNTPATTTFVYYAFNIVATGNDTISFEARNDPSGWFLDDVQAQLCTGCAISNGTMRANKKTQMFPPFKN